MFTLVLPAQHVGGPLWPVLLVIGLLIALNVVNNRVAPNSHFLLWALGGSIMFLAIGLLDGCTFTDMGLSWHYWLRGAIWGAGCILAVTLVYLIGATTTKGRDAFHDERNAHMSGSRFAFQALLEVPFGTVLLEEIAFRSVLFAMLARRYGLLWALVVSSVLFGLWHILPSIGTHEANPALGSVAGQGLRGNIIAVALSVLTTTIAGGLFVGLRLISGSVLAPMGLHWATNGVGYAFSFTIIRTRNRIARRAELARRDATDDPGRGTDVGRN